MINIQSPAFLQAAAYYHNFSFTDYFKKRKLLECCSRDWRWKQQVFVMPFGKHRAMGSTTDSSMNACSAVHCCISWQSVKNELVRPNSTRSFGQHCHNYHCQWAGNVIIVSGLSFCLSVCMLASNFTKNVWTKIFVKCSEDGENNF